MVLRPVVALFVVAALSCGISFAQEEIEVPPGYTLLDDMIVPLGDSSFGGPKWPGGVVPYEFDANVSTTNRGLALVAMAEWSAVANVTFVPKTTETNFLHILSSNATTSCGGSQVGMIGGQQNLTMICWTTKYVICHELGHTLGLLHEQSRSDRNTYMTINTANITAGAAANFAIDTNSVNATAYDPLSIMHYGATAFSNNGQPTITLLPPYTSFQSQIGQRNYMTTLDAQGMQARYGVAKAPQILQVNNGFLQPGANVIEIIGRRFFAGSPTSSGVQGSVVKVNGVAVPTVFVDPTTLNATINPANYPGAQHLIVEVDNPAPAGGLSNWALVHIGTPMSAGAYAITDFDSQGPRGTYTFPSPAHATGDPEFVSVNAGAAPDRQITVDYANGLGMPTTGSQYLRIPGRGTINLPLGGTVSLPGAAATANQAILRMPIGRTLGFAWDWYRNEAQNSVSYNDGFSVDLVDAAGNRVRNLLRGDTAAPTSPSGATQTRSTYGYGGQDTFNNGPQWFAADLPDGAQYLYLAITVWNGGDDSYPSEFVLDSFAVANDSVSFEGQTPCTYTVPTPLNPAFGAIGLDNASWNGAGAASNNKATVDRANGLGMPTAGNRYLRVAANGGSITPPASNLMPLPLTGANATANQVWISIPVGAEAIQFDWDFYAAETTTSAAPYIDGLNIDIVRPNGTRSVNLVSVNTQAAQVTPLTLDGGLCTDPANGAWDTGSTGAQKFAGIFGAVPAGSKLSITCWNGGDNQGSSQAVIDNIVFLRNSGAFNLRFASQAGSGSLQLTVQEGDQSGQFFFTGITTTAGSFPHGWFPGGSSFGISLSLPELFSEAGAGTVPFFGTLDQQLSNVFEIPAGVPPGLTLYAASALFTSGGQFVRSSLPVVYTTP